MSGLTMKRAMPNRSLEQTGLTFSVLVSAAAPAAQR